MNTVLLQKVDNYIGSLGIAALKPVFHLLSKLSPKIEPRSAQGDFTFIKILGGGSLVIALPALLGLRTTYPDRSFRLITSRGVAPFARTLGVFDDIRCMDTNSVTSLVPTALSTFRHSFRSGACINLEVYSKLAAIFQALTLSRCRVGFFLHDTFWRTHLDTHLIFFNRFSGVHHFYDQIAHIFGSAPLDVAACRRHVLDRLDDAQTPEFPVDLAIGHSCSDMAKERMLSPWQWRQVFAARTTADGPGHVCFLGSANDHQAAEAIIDAVRPGLPAATFRNCCGKLSLTQSLQVLSRAPAFWGIDSSLIHYARLFGLRCVSFWGPTDPMTRLRDIPGLEEEVHYIKIPCSPCVHNAEYPPCQGRNACIERLFSTQTGNDSPIPWWASDGQRND